MALVVRCAMLACWGNQHTSHVLCVWGPGNCQFFCALVWGELLDVAQLTRNAEYDGKFHKKRRFLSLDWDLPCRGEEYFGPPKAHTRAYISLFSMPFPRIFVFSLHTAS